MIVARVGPDAVFYRMHTPRWAHEPLSGAGAAKVGGRLNRPGVAALYLSAELNTAAAEYQQTDAMLPPGTLVAYRVTLASAVDFRHGYDPDHWDAAWRDFFCDWRRDAFLARQDPPSWRLGDLARDAGHHGILFSSFARPGGTNLVIFVNELDEGDRVAVHDPAHELPRNQASWR